MSVPDPDEIMDTHAVEEPADENGFEAGNANEIDDDFAGISETLPVASHQESEWDLKKIHLNTATIFTCYMK